MPPQGGDITPKEAKIYSLRGGKILNIPMVVILRRAIVHKEIYSIFAVLKFLKRFHSRVVLKEKRKG